MAIQNGYKANFETLKRAAHDGDLALMECADKVTGKTVVVICAVGRGRVAGEYVFSPLAKMFDGNPYDELNPAGFEEKAVERKNPDDTEGGSCD